jgi:hypothetical protein
MEQKIKSLIDLNRKHSELFCSHRLERDLYRANHPTHVVAFKCMDGRINLPIITHTPLGIIRPYRNIGGKFNLGWPLLNLSFDKLVMKAVREGNRALILVTYHFSEGDEHRGCAGFKYDCEAAKQSTNEFKKQIQKVYGDNSQVVVPILIGVETDKDAIILHGENGEVLDLSNVVDATAQGLKDMIQRLYPNMPERIVEDLLPLVEGNIEHIAEVKGKKPHADLEHGEWVLAVGKGFDWLHTPNMALIVGPYDPNIGEPIKTAASIIKSNIASGKVSQGFVVLASAIYSDVEELLRAKERAIYMKDLSVELIKENHPDMVDMMYPISVVVNGNTMKMEIVE